MRKIGTAIAALGLAALGLAVPATTAQAATTGTADAHCNSLWPGRDGYVRAWKDAYCYNYLGGTQGNDSHWGDSVGAFRGADANNASSVMNSGYTGGRDVVAFYYLSGYTGGYGCLSPYEYYVDNLTRNTFVSGNGANMNDNIMSHRWVYSSGCSSNSWMY